MPGNGDGMRILRLQDATFRFYHGRPAMRQLYRTLSYRDLSRRWPRTLLIAACIGLGVATLVGTQALTSSLAYAAVFTANPTSGMADLIVANGELPVPRSLD